MLDKLNQYYVYFEFVTVEDLNRFRDKLAVKNCVVSTDVGSLVITTSEMVSDLLRDVIDVDCNYEVVKFVYSVKAKRNKKEN